MLAVVFGLVSAIGYAWTTVLMQLGLRCCVRVSPFTALLVNLAGGTVLLLAMAAAFGHLPRGGIGLSGIGYFAASGLVAALAGQAANFAAIDRIGATRTASFVMTDNVFALVLGLLVLAQAVSGLSAAGITLLMVAAMAFTMETAAEDTAGRRGGETKGGFTNWRSIFAFGKHRIAGVGLAVLSGFLFATAGILRALGVRELPSALLGAAINNVAALVVIAGVFVVRGRLREVLAVGWRAGIFLLLSGVASSAGTTGFILALQYGGTVAVTTALKNTQPVFTFALALWLVHKHEGLTWRTAVLVLLVAVGGVMAALGRGG